MIAIAAPAAGADLVKDALEIKPMNKKKGL